MKLIINKEEYITDCATLDALALERKLPGKGVAIAVNNKMVPRAEWEGYALTDGLHITILKAFCGG